MNAIDVSPKQPRLTEESFRRFAAFITDELGIKMPPAKIQMLQGRLQRRMKALGVSSVEDYQELLFGPNGETTERAHFFDSVTTNKTDFFREPCHFDFLTQSALPALDRAPQELWRFNLWCAGCSTGEEAYTLAMTLDQFGLRRGQFDFSIRGTDISTRVLQAAQRAIYSEDIIVPISQRLRERYLLRSKDPSTRLVRVAPTLRHRVTFSRLNFMDTKYPIEETYDVIFFRNVMIYFDKPTQEAVVNKLCRHLAPGGFLFVGHSESLTGLQVPLRLVDSAVYRKPMN
ncbi:CheR family methyltransferase [Pelagicoccus sp. SDUM812003]|uniref:CheR family methyltransferase n=1 Tax=Pelagicoccus sp. SDUM812003 TaxID=3041267 RepID=UPI00280FF605|nr:CheR family methyltransferase [Pelagicoccus sp. SDUM812003]MDQ8203877.1 CheR family methyltransferase [Pelagicoccus sp. SDUM812003]